MKTILTWLLLAAPTFAAGLAQTENFSVIAPGTDEFAQRVANAAESYRGNAPTDNRRTVISVSFGDDEGGNTLVGNQPTHRFHNVFIRARNEARVWPLLEREIANVVRVQCWGDCCPQYCPPCQPCPPPYYSQPSQPSQQRPRPDGVQTPPAPEFEPTAPSVPPVTTQPATPPAPTIDPTELEKWRAEQAKNRDADKTYQEKSVLILQQIQQTLEGQKGCQCDNSKLEAKIDALATAVQNIPKQQPAPGPPAQTEPQIKYYNIVPRKN